MLRNGRGFPTEMLVEMVGTSVSCTRMDVAVSCLARIMHGTAILWNNALGFTNFVSFS